MRHLIIKLEAPLMSFGGEVIDNYGFVRPFPAASMLTGMFANALGWRRVEREAHERLQKRLVFAARIDREPAGGYAMTDYQTALLYADDRGWTTRGSPEGRNRNSPSFRPIGLDGPRALTHERWRDYYADMRVTVALRLHPHPDLPPSRGKELVVEPTLEELAAALDEPARPLFIGRKPCLPSARLCGGFVEAPDALAALLATPLADDANGGRDVRVQWPAREDVDAEALGVTELREMMLTDERNWVSGLHGGGRRVVEGTAPRGKFGGCGLPDVPETAPPS